MQKGFLSFALAAFFLLSFLSAALIVSSTKPDTSYEGYRTFLVFEVSTKRAFYAALSESAKDAFAASLATGTGAREAVEATAYSRALDFEEEMRALGYEAEFWCGSPSEKERAEASKSMKEQKRALLPQGTQPLSDCASSFQTNALSRRLHFSDLGVSLYHKQLGIGMAAIIPSDYEVDY